MVRICSGLREIEPQFSTYFIDIWGVVHDGERPFPGAIQALAELKTKCRKVVLLSNAPRPSAMIAERLDQMGIGSDLYHHIHTSGDETVLFLQHLAKSRGISSQNPMSYYYLGPVHDQDLYAQPWLKRTDDLVQADVVLSIAWAENGRIALDSFDAELAAMHRRNLTMLCANPDKIVHHRGQEDWCAGALAERYAQIGGVVEYCGKPYPSVYASASRACGNPDLSEILMIGDSLRTDITGAHLYGIRSCLIAGGIHRVDLMTSSEDEVPGVEQVQKLCDTFYKSHESCAKDLLPAAGVMIVPDYVLPRLRWE